MCRKDVIKNFHSGSSEDVFWMLNNYALTTSFNDVYITSNIKCLSNVQKKYVIKTFILANLRMSSGCTENMSFGCILDHFLLIV